MRFLHVFEEVYFWGMGRFFLTSFYTHLWVIRTAFIAIFCLLSLCHRRFYYFSWWNTLAIRWHWLRVCCLKWRSCSWLDLDRHTGECAFSFDATKANIPDCSLQKAWVMDCMVLMPAQLQIYDFSFACFKIIQAGWIWASFALSGWRNFGSGVWRLLAAVDVVCFKAFQCFKL